MSYCSLKQKCQNIFVKFRLFFRLQQNKFSHFKRKTQTRTPYSLQRLRVLWRFLLSLVETYGSSLAIAYSTLGFDALLGVSLWPFQTLSCLPKNSDDEKPELVFKNLQTGFRHKNVDICQWMRLNNCPDQHGAPHSTRFWKWNAVYRKSNWRC